ncbi:MAG TPA: carbohydrate binding domain-containing protein [Verrucomicrobiae bacterium]|nr:carbohydrate binding domain-containing protein [Verrucomicrobiae bacterium]
MKIHLKFLFTLACLLAARLDAAPRFADQFVWVFGWNLEKDSDVAEISKLLETAGKSHFNGAVLSCGLDTLSMKSPDFFRRLDAVNKSCDQNGLDLIPAIFSIGYGGGFLGQDPNLAEGLPVIDAPFIVHGNEARLSPTNPVQFKNGDFEDFNGNTFKGFDFHDQPGTVSFADTEIHHGGKASVRLENFTANQYGHGRVMQSIQVQPHRCYRLTLWVKTEGMQPADAFHVEVLAAGDRELAPRKFDVPATTDWRKLTMIFNSLNFDKINLYAGLWGGKSGKVWLDDWTVEEIGPVNVLRRPGTPVTVRSEDGATTYVEGKDYAPLKDPNLSPWHDNTEAVPLKLLPGGSIADGARLRVSWYHSMIIYDSQVAVCMAEPKLYDIIDKEAKLLVDTLHPRSVLLNMDEIRMGGTCQACKGRNMGELLGECITRTATILRNYAPSLEIYSWADMLDPNHNGHGNYYLVDGDFTGAWDHVPKNLIMAVWGGAPEEAGLKFFSSHGRRTLIACYYDADDLKDVEGWLKIATHTPKLRGFMYTPWEKKYALLPAFGDLMRKPAPTAPTP